ncbi:MULTISPECIES: hypothetical protein [unclassified Luteimonas]
MTTQTLLLLCAIHSLGFALFHLAFWALFKWPRTLEGTTLPNRAILQIANVQLVWVFLLVAVLCLRHPRELADTPLGHALLLGMSGFWALRLATQFVWLRVNHPMVHGLNVAFATGAALFALAALTG